MKLSSNRQEKQKNRRAFSSVHIFRLCSLVDSCFFLYRFSRLFHSFPMSQLTDFDKIYYSNDFSRSKLTLVYDSRLISGGDVKIRRQMMIIEQNRVLSLFELQFNRQDNILFWLSHTRSTVIGRKFIIRFDLSLIRSFVLKDRSIVIAIDLHLFLPYFLVRVQ